MRIVFILPLLGSLAGGAVLGLTFMTASGAPQEAAGAAIALGIAIIPYTFARSLEKMSGPKSS